MPAFPMPAADARALVSFLRSAAGTVDEQVAGDPEQGRVLYAARCSRCHMFGGSGGILGPDLTGIAKRTSVAALRQAIQDPDAQMTRRL